MIVSRLKRLFFRVGGKFTLILYEPLSSKTIITHFTVVPGKPLHLYLDKWKGYTAKVDGYKRLSDAEIVNYVPSPGEVIELYPEIGVKSFTNAYIERLNETAGNGGRFMKAAILTESTQPLIKRYYVDNERPVVFNGNEYTPLSMIWSGFELTSTMSLTTMTVTVPNIGGEVLAYVETVDILENDIELQVLHTDLLDDVTAADILILQIQMIQADDTTAAFTVGLNLGLNDLLPREVITKSEFPGLVDDVVRLRA